jgi:polysaccharide pyruvyl transferase WcaK-like protein
VKVSFYGHFGTSNSGNESTLLSILTRLGALVPDCEFSCICSKPDAVAERYGIDGIPICRARPKSRSKLLATCLQVLRQPGEYVRAYRALRDVDAFIVSGTGLVTDSYGLGLSSWGPYNLLKWALMARLRGCKVLFVSVGVGPLDTVPGRWLVKRAFALADYRSYRDGESLRYVESRGFHVNGDRVFPDLAFGLPVALLPPSDGAPEKRRVVGIGLMEYAGRYSAADPAGYSAYLDALIVFAAWVLSRDYDVHLFLGDGDTRAIDRFEALLDERLPGYDRRRVTSQPSTSVRSTLAELAASDVVVATRFHNVLLSFLLDKPVIAVSFHDKCSSLMRGMGLSEYVHDMKGMDPERLIRQFQELDANRADLRRRIRALVEERRAELEAQYTVVLEVIGAAEQPASPVEASIDEARRRNLAH